MRRRMATLLWPVRWMQQLVGLFCMAVYVQGCKSARSGPKSGVCSTVSFRAFSMQFWIGIYIFMTLLHGADGVKVEGIPTLLSGAAGAQAAAAKPSGRTAYDFSRLHCGNLAKQLVRKRSYKRALLRAQQNGITMYRGRCMTAQQAAWFSPPKLVQVHSTSSGRRRDRTSGPRGPTMRVCCLNLGGVCTATHDCLRNWLDGCPFDVVLLQEIHFGVGRESLHWHSRGWSFITSVDPMARFSGVAVLIRNTIAHTDCIRYQELVKGRLLHVRLFPTQKVAAPCCSVDILCLYQHAGDDHATLQGGRQKVWVSLSRCLASLPQRNLLVVGGDFNCSPHPQSGRTGPGHCPPDQYRADASELQDIVCVHDLCVLNTWCSTQDYNMHTFRMGDRLAQIDYILTRRVHATFTARQSRPMWGSNSLDFSPWRGGAEHMAIQCHIQLFPGWRAATSKAGQSIEYDRQALDKAVRHNWPEAQLLREAVQSKLEGAASVTVEYINATLLTCCKEIFPARKVAAQSRPWQHESVQTKVADLWVCRSHFRDTQTSLSRLVAQCQRPRLPVQSDSRSEIAACVFRFWKASSRLQAVYKELRKRGRQRRRQFLEDQLSRAKAASERRDTKELYAVVRQLAPKTHYRKVRIRKVDGTPLCAEAEYLEIHSYFSELFSAGLWQDFHADQPPDAGGYLITPAEVRAALKANKIGNCPGHY